ncbi:MAG TPA: hypothetical protein IGS40_22755 [Trichormus sp. M33_DOE_039]|nr:hypothetical protein [Trichormus sp. M33_DOE_039]
MLNLSVLTFLLTIFKMDDGKADHSSGKIFREYARAIKVSLIKASALLKIRSLVQAMP